MTYNSQSPDLAKCPKSRFVWDFLCLFLSFRFALHLLWPVNYPELITIRNANCNQKIEAPFEHPVLTFVQSCGSAKQVQISWFCTCSVKSVQCGRSPAILTWYVRYFLQLKAWPHRCFQSRFGQVVKSLSKSCSKCAIEASSKEQMVHEAPKKERDVEKFFLLCMFLGRFGDFEIERVERCWTRQVEAHIGDIGPRS